MLGVQPDKPDTNYGYIKRVGHRIIDFYEKPTKDQAEFYLRTGYVWNSGHFFFKASVMLSTFKIHQPEIYKGFRLFYRNRCLDAFYKDLTPINIEKSIIEKTSNLAVIPSTFEWSDIGTIDRLFDIWKGDERFAEKIKAYKRIDQRSRKPN